LLLKVGRENAISVQGGEKKLLLEKTWNEQEELNCWRVLSWNEQEELNCWRVSSILDEQEKKMLATKARNEGRGCCWCARKKLQQQVVT
jgi:hypothetical protein